MADRDHRQRGEDGAPDGQTHGHAQRRPRAGGESDRSAASGATDAVRSTAQLSTARLWPIAPRTRAAATARSRLWWRRSATRLRAGAARPAHEGHRHRYQRSAETVTAMATNPLEAFSYQEREYFTDEYERLAVAARNWQIAFLIAGGTALIAVAALGWLATHSRLIPYVVNVDRQGYALAAPGALVEAEPFAGQDRLIRYELAGFIRAAREVIGDPLAQAR